jgi:hypothetical protein
MSRKLFSARVFHDFVICDINDRRQDLIDLSTLHCDICVLRGTQPVIRYDQAVDEARINHSDVSIPCECGY